MIPVYQTLTTANDGKGNCFVACVASIMELPLRDVPAIASDLNSGAFFRALEDWLIQQGLFPNHRCVAPKGWAIGCGYLGPDRTPHACIVFDGRIVHDPYPLGGVHPDLDSFWTIDPISDDQRPYCEARLRSIACAAQ